MLQVNSEKLLQDYDNLCKKRSLNREQIEEAARVFAITRGYDEERTAAFVKYVQETEEDGLSDSERAKIELLSEYVEDVTVEEEVANEAADSMEADNGEAVNPY